VTLLSVRQTVLLVILFVSASVALIALDDRHTLDPLKTGLHNLVEPAVDWINEVTDRNDDPTSTEIELLEMTKERDQLQAENAQLKLELEDIEHLRQVLGVQEDHPEWRLLTANVINPDPTGLQKLVTIDRGSNDGVEVGMAVVNPYYLVGLVTEVEEESARVTLAIDATFSIGSKLLTSKGVGIVYGQWQTGGRMEMRHVSREVTPVEDELVVTSDEIDARTAKVPGGLIIGKVSGAPELDNQSDSQTIQVLPSTDFDDLSIVAVILSDEGGSGGN
jgi:rod shape-determining protein MreC